MIKRKES